MIDVAGAASNRIKSTIEIDDRCQPSASKISEVDNRCCVVSVARPLGSDLDPPIGDGRSRDTFRR
jgi:hypothetical protein